MSYWTPEASRRWEQIVRKIREKVGTSGYSDGEELPISPEELANYLEYVYEALPEPALRNVAMGVFDANLVKVFGKGVFPREEVPEVIRQWKPLANVLLQAILRGD